MPKHGSFMCIGCKKAMEYVVWPKRTNRNAPCPDKTWQPWLRFCCNLLEGVCHVPNRGGGLFWVRERYFRWDRTGGPKCQDSPLSDRADRAGQGRTGAGQGRTGAGQGPDRALSRPCLTPVGPVRTLSDPTYTFRLVPLSWGLDSRTRCTNFQHQVHGYRSQRGKYQTFFELFFSRGHSDLSSLATPHRALGPQGTPGGGFEGPESCTGGAGGGLGHLSWS